MRTYECGCKDEVVSSLSLSKAQDAYPHTDFVHANIMRHSCEEHWRKWLGPLPEDCHVSATRNPNQAHAADAPGWKNETKPVISDHTAVKSGQDGSRTHAPRRVKATSKLKNWLISRIYDLLMRL